MIENRGPGLSPGLFLCSLYSSDSTVFIMVTNFVLSVRASFQYIYIYYNNETRLSFCQFGGPLAVSVFLIVLSAAGEQHLQTVWRVCFGIGIALPLTVFYFRIRMLTSTLYQKGAIKSGDVFHPSMKHAYALFHSFRKGSVWTCD